MEEITVRSPSLPEGTSAKVDHLVRYASTLIVLNEDDRLNALQALTDIKQTRKFIDDIRTTFTKPLLDLKTRFDGYFKPSLNALDAVDEPLRKRVTDYNNMIRAAAVAAEKAKRAAEIAEELRLKKEADKLVLKTGSDAAITESVQRSANIAKLETAPIKQTQTVRSANFTASESIKPAWRVVDLSAVPRSYLMLDEGKLNALCRAKGATLATMPKIEGIEFHEEASLRIGR